MLERRRPRVGYANVMATAAMFIALGGGAYATHSHLVATHDLRDGAVTAQKIRAGAVNAQKLRAGAVRPRQLRAGAVRNAALADGAVDSAKVLDGSLTGDDIDVSTLAEVDAATLGGLASSDFALAGSVQGRGPVVVPMPAADGNEVAETLISNGPLEVVGVCRNHGDAPRATIGVRHTIELFLLVGAAQGKVTPWPVTFPTSVRTVAEATASAGLPAWDHQRREFSAIGNPPSGARAIDGSAVAMTVSSAGTHACYLSAWGLAS